MDCPICGEPGGFHDEAVHAARPLPEGIRYAQKKFLDTYFPSADLCRACKSPISGPGKPDCRYPKHGS